MQTLARSSLGPIAVLAVLALIAAVTLAGWAGCAPGPHPADAAPPPGDAPLSECASLVPPTTVGVCCTGCSPSDRGCQPNRCERGWWCNTVTCQCKPPPLCPPDGG